MNHRPIGGNALEAAGPLRVHGERPIDAPRMYTGLKSKNRMASGEQPSIRVLRERTRLKMGAGTFWRLLAGIVLVFLSAWLLTFRFVYGWFADDRTVWLTGNLITDSFDQAFRGANALHTLYLLIYYIPIKLIRTFSLSLPSYPLPGLGTQTGVFGSSFCMPSFCMPLFWHPGPGLSGRLIPIWQRASCRSCFLFFRRALCCGAPSRTLVCWACPFHWLAYGF
jgi:hypothetical protein